MGLLRHYDTLLLGDLTHSINHLKLLTLVLQNAVLSATLA
jgi:CRISPR-associated DxTHG motif protein